MSQLRKAALALPQVEEGTHFGMAAFAVAGKGFASVTKEGVLQLQLPEAVVDAALATQSTGERLTRMGMPIGLAVPLVDVNGKDLNALVRASWEHRAPKRLLAATRAAESTADHGLPVAIGRPATRALLGGGGITSLDEVARRSDADLLALHGVGPRAVRLLREAIAAE